MRGNTITIELPLKRGKVSKTIPLYQYDYGQKLIITDVELPSYYEVHFSNEMHGDAVTSIGDSTGVEIPDSLLATGENVYLWLYLHDSDSDGETEFQGAIPVIRRARVTDQTPTPHERTIIEQAVSALNSAVSDVAGKVEDAEAAQIAAEAAQAAAETAQSKAEDAQEAAETAQDAAEDAQTAAETAQGKAEDAQGAAETAQGKAEDAQGAAESAQSAAEGFAGNASDSADDAEAWAVGTEDSTHPAHGNSAKDWAEEAAEVVQGIIDDTAGDGDTDKTWSADKMHDQFALKADKWDPTIYGKISHGRKGGSTAGTNSAVIGGDNAVASGSHAVAEGQFTIAAGAYQRASGKFNVEDSNGTYAEIIGNGYAEIDPQTFVVTEHRSNARALDWNGNETLAGDLTVNKGKTNEMNLGSEVSNLKNAFYGLQIDNLPIAILKNKYVTNDAQIADYTGWDCTDYIPVKGYKSLKVKSNVQSGYNVFVDASKVKVGNNFTVKTSYTTVNVPSGAVYVLMSNTAAGMENLEASFEKYPVMDGKHPETETALSQLVNMGVYNIEKAKLSTFEDRPSDVDNAVATLINYSGAYASSAYTIQRLYQLSGKAWERIIYSPTGETTTIWKRIDLDADASNILKGKKLVTAGDSYTQAYWDGDYAEYNGKNYGYYIAQRNQMTFVNSGISGSTMAVPPGGAGNKNPFVIDRYTAVPADTDYLTIWFGINDAANCDLGSITDGDDGTPVNNTIYGAWNIVLKYYLTNRPWMKVLIIVPSMPSSESANNVRNAIRAVAKKWGYPYLDWQMDYSIPAFFDKREGMSDEAVSLRRAAFGYNGPNTGHPNPQWYEYESTIIEARLRSI